MKPLVQVKENQESDEEDGESGEGIHDSVDNYVESPGRVKKRRGREMGREGISKNIKDNRMRVQY